MKKYYYKGKKKENAIELALEELKITEEDLIINKKSKLFYYEKLAFYYAQI